MTEVRLLTALEARELVPALAAVLVDCVEGGASVSFMAGFGQVDAERFFGEVADDVAAGGRLLLGGFVEGRLLGSVQVILRAPPNQPHRGDLAKLLVHRDARHAGLGGRLVSAAEEAAREAGKTLLVLDTVEGSAAERLYLRLGWTRVGVIPDYALFPDGRLCNTVIFYRRLSPDAVGSVA